MLQIQAAGPVLYVTLDRPDVRNAFNDELITALRQTFESLDPGVRAVVLAGNGKAFSAGGDLEWMRRAAGYTEEQNYADAMNLAGLFQAIVACPAVVIARVQGAAFGGGCGLVCCADVAVAQHRTQFSFSEVKLGLIPATISPFVVPKIGAGHARALFSTGIVFDEQRALRIGLVHDVAEEAVLDETVELYVDSVLKSGPLAVREAKRLAAEGPPDLDEAARRLARARAGEEGREGVAAFLEKRPASFVVNRHA